MAVTYLAIGSNVGDSEHFIGQAIKLLQDKITEVTQAPIYRSKAVGYTNQSDFFNTVVQGKTDLKPQELLKFVKTVEQKVGRVERFRWGPREIDIDIIFYGDQIIDESSLHIPHARFAERDFVLRPITDLNPEFIDPRSKLTVTQLYAKLPETNRSIYL